MFALIISKIKIQKLFAIFLFLQITNIAVAKDHKSENSNFLMDHIADSHEWHIATIGHKHISVPLPVILYKVGHGVDMFLSNKFINQEHKRIPCKGYILNYKGKIKSIDKAKVYDLSLTKNIVSMLISVILMFIIFITASRKYKKRPKSAPKGFWMFIEMLIVFIKDEIAVPNIGKKQYTKFMPYLLTIFFFIWINNLMGLLPGSANVTGNIAVTLTLAAFTFIITNINGNKNYWAHIFKPSGIPFWLLPIMIPVEIIGLFTKPFSLMIRLFANITAGHIILLSIINIIFIFKSPAAGLVSVPFGAFMFMLKLLVAFLQAYVFTLMSAIYFGHAVDEDH
ncbi:MAG: F0F1 ATP synthase subunit A [Bacteroidetes bacterium]|nr:F0F1 ATP synthase subunit A [Bacteroidota bacterium]